MRCPRCQAENPPGTRFCGQCATSLAAVCHACGASNPPGNKFCGQCAAPLATPTPPPAAPESYTPKHLAEKILTSKPALEGERKQVTVLFADLKGSMELLADRDPEEARAILDPVLELMMEAVHRYEGTVNQVMGDGIMALFGAPLAHEDHAVRGCYAALRMQESVLPHAERVLREHGLTLRIRVGLNSGEVVVRTIGSDLRMDYSALGQTTHLAARMEQLADPGSILLAPGTLALAESYVEVRSLGPVPVKGMPAPVEVHELTGIGAVRSRLQAAAARGLSRFVGRDAETEQLHSVLEQARQGRGQVAAVVGEPGVGKSRLVLELTRSHRARGWLILEAGSQSYGKATSYQPVTDLLKEYFRIGDRDTQQDIREKVTGRLFALDRGLAAALPAILSLLEVAVDDPAWQAADPQERRRGTLDAVKRLLLRESQAQPLLLVFEDLHWIDGETQALLDVLVEGLPAARLLLLVSYRPEYRHGWGGKSYYRQVRIDALGTESADAFLAGLLGTDPSLVRLKRLLIERTQGNPFFLEETVRALVETGVLSGDRGGCRVTSDARTFQVPATVHAILAARIDRLPAEDKRLLETASIIGQDVPFSLLQSLASLPEDDLRRGLVRLQTAELLYEARLFPDLEFKFKHALTHEVAYGSLLQERRRALHAEMVDVIEAHYADRLGEHVEALALHARRAARWDKAVHYLRQAAARAALRSAHPDAVSHCDKALAALEHLPPGRERTEQAIDLRFDLRASLLTLAEFGRILDCMREAEALGEQLGDQRRLGWAKSHMMDHMCLAGEHARAVQLGQRALRIATAVGDSDLEIVTGSRLGQTYYDLGDYRAAVDFLGRTVAATDGPRRRERFGWPGPLSAFAGAWLAWSLAELGRFPEAIHCAEQGLRTGEDVGQPWSLFVGYFGLGLVRLRQRDLMAAIPLLERCRELGQVGEVRLFSAWIAAALGYAYALAGRVAEGLELLEQGAQASERAGIMTWYALLEAWLAEGYLLAARPDDAVLHAARAVDIGERYGESGHRARAVRVQAEIAALSKPPDVELARERYRQGMALADERGMRTLAAECHLGLGRLHRDTGDHDQAQTQMNTARRMYDDMGIGNLFEQAEANVASPHLHI